MAKFLVWGIGWGTDSQPLVKILNKQVDTRDRDPLPFVHTCPLESTGVMPPLCARENSFPNHVPQKVCTTRSDDCGG